MAANTLLFTVVSGLVLLAMLLVILRVRSWRQEPAAEGAPAESGWTRASEALNSPTTWTFGFLLLVLLAVTGALAVVGGLPIPEATQAAATTAVMVATGLVLAGFVFAGIYSSVRSRGLGSAPAVGLGSLVIGVLALVVVVAHLFLG